MHQLNGTAGHHYLTKGRSHLLLEFKHIQSGRLQQSDEVHRKSDTGQQHEQVRCRNAAKVGACVLAAVQMVLMGERLQIHLESLAASKFKEPCAKSIQRVRTLPSASLLSWLKLCHCCPSSCCQAVQDLHLAFAHLQEATLQARIQLQQV